MGLNLVIDPSREGPLYKQIADSILTDIYAGKLPSGFQLPTVRELADEMGLSRGTVRHAYEYLVRAGAIEMTQGRGTFILGVEEKSSSRKERAMAAFDELFNSLSNLGFTPREMSIYFKLKMQGLEEAYDFVKAAVVDCNPETIRQIEKQLSEIGYVETAGFSLDQVSEAARKLNNEYDLVLTTSTHFAEVEAVVGDSRRMAMMAMRPTTQTIIQLARLDEGEKVGIASASKNFVDIVRGGCRDMGPWSKAVPSYLFGSDGNGVSGEKVDVKVGQAQSQSQGQGSSQTQSQSQGQASSQAQSFSDFLAGLTTVIVPESYREFASAKETESLAEFRDRGGKILHYDYAIDKGSFIYIKELITRVLNRKRSI